MRNGAEYLDLTYERRIPGRRVNEDQSLAFPRYDLQDPYTGFAIPHDEVPVNLKRANVEAAVRADDEKATGGGLGPVSSGLVVQEFDKVGPLETARVYAAGTVVRTDGTASRKYPKIEALMARYFQTGVIERA